MQLVFSDAQYWEDFLPLTFTKPISELRCGILTFAERWEKLLDIREKRYITEEYLEVKYPRYEKKESLLIVPNFLPTEKVLDQIKNLQFGEALVYENELLVAKINLENFGLHQIEKMMDIEEELTVFKHPTDLFSFNEKAINFDFDLLTNGRISQPFVSDNG